MNLLAGRCISSHIVSSICRRLLDDPAAHNQAMSRRARAPGCCLAAAAKAARSERERRFHGNRQARKGRKSIDGCELHCNNKRPLSPRSLPQSLGFLIRDRKKVKLEFHVCSQFSPSCLWFSPPGDTFPNVNLVSRVFHAAPRSAAPVAIVDGSSVPGRETSARRSLVPRPADPIQGSLPALVFPNCNCVYIHISALFIHISLLTNAIHSFTSD